MEHVNEMFDNYGNPKLAELLAATPTTELAHIISILYQIDVTTQRLLELSAQHPDIPLTETASTDPELDLLERAKWVATTIYALPLAQPATLGVLSIAAQWAAAAVMDHMSEEAFNSLQNLWASTSNDKGEHN